MMTDPQDIDRHLDVASWQAETQRITLRQGAPQPPLNLRLAGWERRSLFKAWHWI